MGLVIFGKKKLGEIPGIPDPDICSHLIFLRAGAWRLSSI
jgi:hypothetical protein